MKRYKFLLLLFAVCLSFSKLISQTIDKVYNKRHYNYCRYYYSESIRMQQDDTANENKLFCLGNYADAVRSGHWVYFYPTGKPFASGHYKNGYKIGDWKIYSADKITIVNYSKKQMVRDCVYVNSYGNPEITDTMHVNSQVIIKKIGQQATRFRILD